MGIFFSDSFSKYPFRIHDTFIPALSSSSEMPVPQGAIPAHLSRRKSEEPAGDSTYDTDVDRTTGAEASRPTYYDAVLNPSQYDTVVDPSKKAFYPLATGPAGSSSRPVYGHSSTRPLESDNSSSTYLESLSIAGLPSDQYLKSSAIQNLKPEEDTYLQVGQSKSLKKKSGFFGKKA